MLQAHLNLFGIFFSDGVKEIWEVAEITKIQYTGKNNHTIFIFNSEELEKAVFADNICKFHIFYKLHDIGKNGILL